jgi:hypothetical protein
MQPVTVTRPPRVRPTTRRIVALTLGALAAAAAAWSLAAAIRAPAFVDEVVVTNPTDFDIDIRVSGRGSGEMVLGIVPADTTEEFRSVVDQGDEWTFRFSYAGASAGDLVVARSTLQADDWRVEVPPEVGDSLKLEGYEPRR